MSKNSDKHPPTISEEDAPGRFRRTLRRVGIELGRGDGHWRVRLRRRLFVIIGLLIIFAIGAMAGLARYSESPRFCRSCHIMEPYYQAWASSVHNTVACVKCHYAPGPTKEHLWHKFQALSQVAKYVTRTYSSKPFAEVDDASCLREGCHSTRLLEGRVISESGVRFDHRPHLEHERFGRQLRCVSCHSQVVVGKHMQVTWDTCYLCHMKGRKDGRNVEPKGGCLGCHELPRNDIKSGSITYNHQAFLADRNISCESCHQDVVEGAGNVPKDRCFTCHNDPDKLANRADIDGLHENHVTMHKVACFHCHEEIIHGAAPAGTKSLNYDCSLCHAAPHDLQKLLYRGVGSKTSDKAMPSPMYEANVDCIGCHSVSKPRHQETSEATTLTGTDAGCVECHSPKFNGILDASRALFADDLNALMTCIETARSNLPDDAPAALKETIAALHYDLDFVKEGRPVHNFYYVAHVLRTVHAKLAEFPESVVADCPDVEDLPVVSGKFCAQLCHQRLDVDVPPTTVTYKGKEMPHGDHVDSVEVCTKCHVFGVHKDVQMRPNVVEKVCSDCHEADEF